MENQGVVSVPERSVQNPEVSLPGSPVVLSERQHRTVDDFSSREALRDALEQSFLEPSDATSSSTSSSFSCSSGSSTSSSMDADTAPIRDWLLDGGVTNPDIDEEVERLMDLKSYMILDLIRMDARDTQFDRMAQMAEGVFDNRFKIAITLVDLGRQHFLTYTPVMDRVIPRQFGFCSHALLHKEDVMVVPDCSEDERYKENPFVTGFPHLRFYAAAPLVSKRGHRLGFFCLGDIKPHPEGLTCKEKQTLKEFAGLAMEVLENHRTAQTQRMQLQQASRALASAAHDLLTPLTGIQLTNALLMEDADFIRKLQDSQKESLRTAGHCMETMVGICESIRHTNEAVLHNSLTVVPLLLDDTTKKSPSAVFNVHKTVERLHEVTNATGKAKVPISVVLDPSVPSFVVGNEVAIFRAALNLLNVSSERTVSGFVGLTVHAERINPAESRLVFECEDTGPVLKDLHQHSSNEQQQVFFTRTDVDWVLPRTGTSYRSDKETASSFYHLINQLEDLGSSLAVAPKVVPNESDDSSKLSTLCFSFRLPLVVSECDTTELQDRDTSTSVLAQHKMRVASPRFSPRRRTVLVVDDSPVIRKVIARSLSKIGVDAAMACNGLEGLQLMKEQAYDFVLLDFLM